MNFINHQKKQHYQEEETGRKENEIKPSCQSAEFKSSKMLKLKSEIIQNTSGIINPVISIEDIIRHLPFGILILDKDFTIQHYNKLFMRFFKCRRTNEILNKLNNLAQKCHQIDEQTPPKLVLLRQSTFKLSFLSKYSSGNRLQGLRCSDYPLLSQEQKSHCYSQQFFNFKNIMDESSPTPPPILKPQIKSSYQYLQKLFLHDQESQESPQKISHRKLIFQQVISKEKLNLKVRFLDANIEQNEGFDGDKFFIVIVEDITKKKSLKKIQQKFLFQRKLINSFSHELKTPMNNMVQQMQSLLSFIDPQLQKQYLLPALVSNQRLIYQINDIIDYGQLESQNFQICQAKFTFQFLKNQIFYLFDGECQQKNIKLQFDIQKIVENSELNNDYGRIIQIIINLINNSLKFTQQGGNIIIFIEQLPDEFNKIVYKITVEDNGSGIHEDELRTLRLALQPVQTNQSQQLDSYFGLGLKIANLIANYLSISVPGQLFIESKIKFGTKVSFLVEDLQECFKSETKFEIDKQHEFYVDEEIVASIERPQEKPQQVYSAKNNFLKKFNQKCKCNDILICDDIPFNHMAIKNMLRKFKLQADSAFNGNEAIEMVKQKLLENCKCFKQYKIIFMDIEMPEKDGFQTTEEIFKIIPNDLTSIVLCSAYSGNDMLQKAQQYKMSAVLPKPIILTELQKILNNFLFY